MPPLPRSPVATFRPPPQWRMVYRRIAKFRQELPPRDEADASSWWRRETGDAEARRFHMLVGLMLSSMARGATCTAAMNGLVRDGLTPQSVQTMGEAQLRERIKSISFCNTKAKHITQAANIILRDYNGKVPREYDEVIALPGVGPKMANLFFSGADKRLVGIGVDTHVHRLSQRLGWVPSTVKSPEDTRKCLESWLPRKYWEEVNFNLVTLGRHVCRARRPRCETCCVRDLCPSAHHFNKGAKKK